VAVISGAPPCQPFSLGGKHGGRGDARDMFPEAVRSVREIGPKAFVFENVKGLLRQNFASYLEYIVLQLTYPSMTRDMDEPWESHLARLERHHTIPFKQCRWHDPLGQQPFELSSILLGCVTCVECRPQVLGQELMGYAQLKPVRAFDDGSHDPRIVCRMDGPMVDLHRDVATRGKNLDDQ
jgi:hypothetical protein